MQYKRRGFWCTKNNRRVVGETVKSRSTYFSPRVFSFPWFWNRVCCFVSNISFSWNLILIDILILKFVKLKVNFSLVFILMAMYSLYAFRTHFHLRAAVLQLKVQFFEKKEKEDHFCVWSSFLAKNLQWVLQVEKSPRKRGLYAK